MKNVIVIKFLIPIESLFAVGVKIGVGILLALVAHQIIIKKISATSEFLNFSCSFKFFFDGFWVVREVTSREILNGCYN